MHHERARRRKRICNTTWLADQILLHMKGKGCQNFLSVCSASGIKLWRVNCTVSGYTAWAPGASLEQLQGLAEKGGWTLEIMARRGPGTLAEKLCARLGLPAGIILAIILLRLFSAFVWNIDFGTSEKSEKIRDILLDNGIVEGAAIDEEKLKQAEEAIQKQSENGWVSLHFTEGCLFVETNALRQQQIETQDTETALYSKSDALVLSTDIQSGFSAIEIGQYVAKGQLLVDNAKFGRTGNIVKQETEGRVIGRLEKTYRVTCNLTETQTVLSGKSLTKTVTYFMGRRYEKNSEKAKKKENTEGEESDWQPLRLGQLVLPGCQQTITSWPNQTIKTQHTEEYVEAVAKRMCRLNLAEEFPDAIVEKQEITLEKGVTAVTAECRYTLRADLTQRGAPPEHVFVEP